MKQTTNYLQEIPNSHFWTNLKMLKYDIETKTDIDTNIDEFIAYLLIGIDNCIKHGYDLRKKKKRKKITNGK